MSKIRKKYLSIPDDELHKDLLAYLRDSRVEMSHSRRKQLQQIIRRNKLSIIDKFHPLHDSIVTCLIQDELIVLKKSEIEDAIKIFHSKMCRGALKIQKRMGKVFVPLPKPYIQRVINKQGAEANPSFLNKPPLRPIRSTEPMELLEADTVSLKEYPCTVDGRIFRYVLSVICTFSRYLWLRPLENVTATAVAKEMEKIFKVFGAPEILLTDNGTEFKGAVEGLCSKMKIQMRHGRVRHPQTTGKVERSHQQWKHEISLNLEKDTDFNWVDELPEYEHLYNTGHHRSIGTSPFEAFFMRKCRMAELFVGDQSTGKDLVTELNVEAVDLDVLASEESHAAHKQAATDLRDKIEKEDARTSNYMMERHMAENPVSVYKVGEFVLVKRNVRKGVKRGGRKLAEPAAQKAKILIEDSDHFRYKVLEIASNKKYWVPVSEITSVTREEENKKQAEKSNVGMQCACSTNCMHRPALHCERNMYFICCRKQSEGPCSFHSQAKVKRSEPKPAKTTFSGGHQQQVEQSFSPGNGLVNLGNTCYINAVFQCLRSTPLERMIGCHACQDEKCLVCCVKTFLKKGASSPFEIVSILQERRPSFDFFEQQDSHEFFLIFVDELKGALADDRDEDIFHGLLKQKIACQQCGKESTTNQEISQFTVQPMRSLVESLNYSMRKETFTKDDANEYFCSSCNATVEAVKDVKITEFPTCLVIQVERFSSVQNKNKITAVEEVLDLSHLSLSGEAVLYQLDGLVEHRGASIDSGHYVAFVREGTKWYRKDDQMLKRREL